MSINSDINHSQANTPEPEVEGLRRLVEEQRKLIEKLGSDLEVVGRQYDDHAKSHR